MLRVRVGGRGMSAPLPAASVGHGGEHGACCVRCVQGYNTVTVELWTHARDGLSENDFIVAAKIDMIDKADLLSKKPLPEE